VTTVNSMVTPLRMRSAPSSPRRVTAEYIIHIRVLHRSTGILSAGLVRAALTIRA
jgi:hypothetical protein